MPEVIKIRDREIGLGEHEFLDLKIARLPTFTEINMPVRVYRAPEDGPVMLLTGGLHGDEVNGLEIIRQMVRDESLIPQRGTVIAIPLVNIYGFIQSSRGMPDGKDINRSFPGVRSGSLARLLAYTLMTHVVPVIDIGLDFHTGGASRANYPQIRGVLNNEQIRNIAEAFEAPFMLHSNLIDKSFRKAAWKKGKPILVYESGEASRLYPKGIEIGINGILRVMKHLGMKKEAPEAATPSQELSKSTWLRARRAGIFHTEVKLGSEIRKNQRVGYLSDPFGEKNVPVKAGRSGYIIGLNNAPVVHKGDALMHVGYQKS